MTDAQPRTFADEQVRLSALPRAERFEQLLNFPTHHSFKVIGPTPGLSDALSETLAGLGYAEVRLRQRHSTGKRHLSLSFELLVESGEHLDQLYSVLERMSGAAYVI